MALVVKNLSANAGDLRDERLIPEPGRSPGEGNGYHFNIFAWRIPWTEKPSGLQSMELRRVGYGLVTEEHNMYVCMCAHACAHACVHVCSVPSLPGNAFSLRYCCLVSCRALSLFWLGKLPFSLFAWPHFSPYGKFPYPFINGITGSECFS